MKKQHTTTRRPKTLLVGWDAADWMVIRPLLAAGHMPNLSRLMANGISGNLATIYPPFSPMLWTSIATGKRAGKHGIHGFIEPDPGGNGVRPISSLSRRAKAFWNIFNQNDIRPVVIGWWPSHPAEPIDGVMVSNLYHHAGEGLPLRPLLPDAVHPPEWGSRMAELRVTPTELPGEVLRLFVPEYHKVDQGKDKRLHSLAKIIAETMTVHAAATEALEHAEWDFAAVYYDAIDHFGHGFMNYHPPRLDWIDEASFEMYQHVITTAYRYHDSMLGRLLHLAGPDANVIVLSDHGFHSDSRRPSYIPPEMAGPAVEHRHFGMVCLSGPAFRTNETLYGSVVLDIAPTLLHLYGLPVGQDMDGKVLVNAFQKPAPVQTIPTWETVGGNSGQHPAEARLDPHASAEAMKQLIALGYIAPPPKDVQQQIRECVAELKYNLARAYDDENRYDLSTPMYEELLAAEPDDHRYAEHHIRALMRLGRFAEARTALQTYDTHCERRAPEALAELEQLEARIAERRTKQEADTNADGAQADAATENKAVTAASNGNAEDANPNDEPACGDRREHLRRQRLAESATGYALNRALLRFQLDMHQGRLADAEASFAALEQLCAHTGTDMPNLVVAELFARRGKVKRSLEWVERALAQDADDWQAQNLAAQLHLTAKHYNRALEMAAQSLSLVYYQPLMHYVMGMALMGNRDYAGAEQPLRIAIMQVPGFQRAHELLSRLYADYLRRPDDAVRHYLQAERLKKARKTLQEKAGAGEQADVSDEPDLLVAAPISRPVFSTRNLSPNADPEREVIVVCGLPRSGTSMLMQMLAAGGITPLTDGQREADEDNPRGYFEYEQATRLHQNKAWVKDAEGKVVKLVLPLVPFLPPGHSYRILVIQRNLDAVLASQKQMLKRLKRQEQAAALSDESLQREYCAQEKRVADWLETRAEVSVLPVEYDAILRDPCGVAAQVGAFLGRNFDVSAAAQAVEPTLKRQSGASTVIDS